MSEFTLHHGDCLEVLRGLRADSIDAIVTDPPYGLAFMGKKWDYDVPSEDIWRECLRVLKPGGHLLAFAGTRTQHRMAVRIEDAGFEIRDMIAWVYGSGFPKSLDVSKAIDKAAGAEREVVGEYAVTREFKGRDLVGDASHGTTVAITAPATREAQQWSGWGTALKPALEPITVARKPLEGTVAANVLTHGTGALNVDGCRVGADGGTRKTNPTKRKSVFAYGNGLNGGGCVSIDAGRWPANLIHDGSDGPTDLLGHAARFFYCAKASKADRDEGCRHITEQVAGELQGRHDGSLGGVTMRSNHHPTVKPTELMRYLCRLVTAPGGLVLDPFMGSGSTGKAAMLEGFRFVGIEREEEYVEIARARIRAAMSQQRSFL